MTDSLPRSVSVSLEDGLVIVRNVRTKPHISYADNGKPILGAQIVHDMIFHLDAPIKTTGMDKETRKFISEGLRNETKQLVIDYQRILRPSGPKAFDKTPEININALRNGGGLKQSPLQGLLKRVAMCNTVDEIDKGILALKARKGALTEAAKTANK